MTGRAWYILGLAVLLAICVASTIYCLLQLQHCTSYMKQLRPEDVWSSLGTWLSILADTCCYTMLCIVLAVADVILTTTIVHVILEDDDC